MTVSSAFGTSSTIPLGAAATVNGVTFLSFSAAGATGGNQVSYSILDTGNSEIGIATYTSSNTTLTSRTPTKSTNGGAAITASSAALIYATLRGEDLPITQAAGKTDQQTGTSSTLAVTPSQQQSHDSAAKAWVCFAGTTGTIVASYNVSSVTRSTVGTYVVNFTTTFASSNGYAAIGSQENNAANGYIKFGSGANKSSNAISVFALNAGGTGLIDPDYVDVAFYGRQ